MLLFPLVFEYCNPIFLRDFRSEMESHAHETFSLQIQEPCLILVPTTNTPSVTLLELISPIPLWIGAL